MTVAMRVLLSNGARGSTRERWARIPVRNGFEHLRYGCAVAATPTCS
jgi:hypothetical protein